MNGLVKQSYRLGEWLLKLLKLQFYWLVYTLKGGVVLGLFPATGTVFKIVTQWLSEPEDEIALNSYFASYYHDYFKELNKLGYLVTGLLLVVVVDLQVSKVFIQSYWLHYFLVGLFILVLGTALYLFPVFARYNLTSKEYLKQSFYFFVTNIVETVAMLVGFFLVVLLLTFLPFLLFVASVPLFVLPISWFALQGMRKLELKKEKA